MIGLATGALLAAVWQGVLLAAVVWLGLRMLPKTPAAVRFAIWFGVFLVVTALPMASLWPHAAGAMRVGGRGAWMTLDMRWSLAIAAVWGAASLVRAAKLVVAAVRVCGLWKRAKAVAVCGEGVPQGLKPQEQEGCYGTAEAVPLTRTGQTITGRTIAERRAQLCVSDEVDRPTVIGFFAPKILIPSWLLEKLTPAELEQIVLHEASHLGRADDWMNLLQKIALVIFPLNPALAWVERRLCFERELAVDDRVLRAFSGKSGAATAYASCLVTVAGHRLGRQGLALALGALGRESELGRRIRRILRRGEMMRPMHARLVLGGALMVLLGATAGLERCPQLVGFAAGAPTVSRADLVNVDGPMMSRVMLHKDDVRAGVVVPHEVLTTASVIQTIDGNGQKSGPQRLKLQTVGAGDGTAKAAPLTKTVDANGAGTLASNGAGTLASNGARTVALNGAGTLALNGAGTLAKRTDVVFRDSTDADRVEANPEQRPTRVMQWLVVTEWRNADGVSRTSRMVMTTAPVENPAVKAQRIQSDTAPAPQQDSEEVHPYAAVPVVGGWLVFQL